MPNPVKTLATMSIQDIYSLIYSVYENERIKLRQNNPANQDPSVGADILQSQIAYRACIDNLVNSGPEEIAKDLFLLTQRFETAQADPETRYYLTAFVDRIMHAWAINTRGKRLLDRAFLDTSEAEQFATNHNEGILKLRKHIESAYETLNRAPNLALNANIQLSADDLSFLEARKAYYDLFDALVYAARQNVPEVVKNVLRTLNEIKPKLTPLDKAEQRRLIADLSLHASTLKNHLTPETDEQTKSGINNILGLFDDYLYKELAENIKNQLTDYKRYLEETYGQIRHEDSLPNKKYRTIIETLAIFNTNDFASNKIDKFTKLLEINSGMLSSFQSITDPGINFPRMVQAIGQAIVTFFKSLFIDKYKPLSKGGELVKSVNELIASTNTLFPSPEAINKTSISAAVRSNGFFQQTSPVVGNVSSNRQTDHQMEV